jgi:hypothetical protein
MIPHPKKSWGPPYPPNYAIIGQKKEVFPKVVLGF